MNNKYLLLVPILTFVIAGKARLSRSASQEFERLKNNQIEAPIVNLEEFWPFPQAISESNPSLFELEQQLLNSDINEIY